MRPKPSGRVTLREITVKKRIDGQPLEYSTFLLSGWVRGKRYRKQFKSRDLALGEKNALEVDAANVGGEVRARNTRLSAAQLAEAEAAMARLGPHSHALAVECFLTTLPRPPVEAMAIEMAVTAFLAERAGPRQGNCLGGLPTHAGMAESRISKPVRPRSFDRGHSTLPRQSGHRQETLQQPAGRPARVLRILPGSAARVDNREPGQTDPEVQNQSRNARNHRSRHGRKADGLRRRLPGRQDGPLFRPVPVCRHPAVVPVRRNQEDGRFAGSVEMHRPDAWRHPNFAERGEDQVGAPSDHSAQSD